ncbi:GNAT family N-acetyltransferase [Methylobrevis pamukkalensis]|uniref:Ribosomal-protein-alanine N-acetyltransferase n=1 Tax=Methylobrevis pamukkalensis TaxID=1439726 RepID=A0A1E3GZV5_9HYPH|nr:GNAT family N-acetyltransferase [Methylobrevis pamukkalensis]ODN69096.1 ribosomal-protein-alanine N-acetyltransferase [Methylobrevis pamukkalensis]
MAAVDLVRRLECAALNARPAAFLVIDGSWLTRVTPGHPAKRLNSLTCLDPADDRNMHARMMHAFTLIASRGQQPCLRRTPLTPVSLGERIELAGAAGFDAATVEILDLQQATFDEDPAVETNPADFARAVAALSGRPDLDWAGVEALGARVLVPSLDLALRRDGEIVAAGSVVVEDDLAGIFDLAVAPHCRRQGYGRRLMSAMLARARTLGARRAYLQVMADNDAALGLYRSMGFQPVYGYDYLVPPMSLADESRLGSHTGGQA